MQNTISRFPHKLGSLQIHGDHLSIYVRNLTPADDDTGLAVGGTGKYVHTQVRTVDECNNSYCCSVVRMGSREPDSSTAQSPGPTPWLSTPQAVPSASMVA
jgi:hypothetical protein